MLVKIAETSSLWQSVCVELVPPLWSDKHVELLQAEQYDTARAPAKQLKRI